MLKPTVKLQTLWRDRDGREAQLQLYLPSNSTREQAEQAVLLAISRVLDLSNAVCSQYKLIWEGTNASEDGAALTSDVNRAGWLFYRNEDNFYEAMRIPSLRDSLLETEGSWAGVRIVAKTTPAGAPLLALEGLTAFLVTAEGEPFPGELVNGGLIL